MYQPMQNCPPAEDAAPIPGGAVTLEAADNGEREYQTAMKYELGFDVERNDREAVRLYHEAAAKGCAAAQFGLAVRYACGLMVDIDEKQATHWYRRAAESGHVSAQYILGLEYECGFNVEKDTTRAVTWFKKAALNGHADAQARLDVLQDSVPNLEKVEVPKNGRSKKMFGLLPQSLFQKRVRETAVE